MITVCGNGRSMFHCSAETPLCILVFAMLLHCMQQRKAVLKLFLFYHRHQITSQILSVSTQLTAGRKHYAWLLQFQHMSVQSWHVRNSWWWVHFWSLHSPQEFLWNRGSSTHLYTSSQMESSTMRQYHLTPRLMFWTCSPAVSSSPLVFLFGILLL